MNEQKKITLQEIFISKLWQYAFTRVNTHIKQQSKIILERYVSLVWLCLCLMYMLRVYFIVLVENKFIPYFESIWGSKSNINSLRRYFEFHTKKIYIISHSMIISFAVDFGSCLSGFIIGFCQVPADLFDCWSNVNE